MSKHSKAKHESDRIAHKYTGNKREQRRQREARARRLRDMRGS